VISFILDRIVSGIVREVIEMAGRIICVLAIVSCCTQATRATGILIDHNDTDITALTEASINYAKSKLHIAYGHTSHGSQLTSGMNGLVGFANSGGLGLSLPTDIFDWNNGGSAGALDLHDYAMGGDVGYYPQWVNNTTNYLNNPSNSDVNVIIWSWCGQVSSKYAFGTLGSEYLEPMTALEAAYPNVTFVYMTGHVDHWADANNKAANQAIRDYCAANNKVLYDFADIESYDPDGVYYEFPSDNCDYYASQSGPYLGNWADQWQASHTEGVDWYNCSSAHSRALNANLKAYAAWALWTEIATSMRPLGDTNSDDVVDLLDYDNLIDQFGSQPGAQSADFNGDNRVDLQDFAIMRRNCDLGPPPAPQTQSAANVPEPATLILLAAGMPILLKLRRHRNWQIAKSRNCGC